MSKNPICYEATLEKDCEPHYFVDEVNAFKYVWNAFCDVVESREDMDAKEIIEAYQSLAESNYADEHCIGGIGCYCGIYPEDR